MAVSAVTTLIIVESSIVSVCIGILAISMWYERVVAPKHRAQRLANLHAIYERAARTEKYHAHIQEVRRRRGDGPTYRFPDE